MQQLKKLLDIMQPFHDSFGSDLFFKGMVSIYAEGSAGFQLIQRSHRLASAIHFHDRRKSGELYTKHLEMSALIVSLYGRCHDAETIAGTIMHDAPEDHGEIWTHDSIVRFTSERTAEISSWCNKRRFDILPFDHDARRRLFLENLLEKAPEYAAQAKLAETLHNLLTPYWENLQDKEWRDNRVHLAREYYAMLAKKWHFLYHEIQAAADALEGGECLLPTVKPAETSLD